MMGPSACWAMRTRRLFIVCALAILASTPADGHALARRVQEQDDPDEFTYHAGGPDLEGEDHPTGVTASGITVNQFPALDDQGVGMIVANFEPCGISLPHVHPRATEMIYMLSGTLRTAFVEETGGVIVNDISAGDATFTPQGLLHYQQNLGCEEASYVSTVNNEDPGVTFEEPMYFFYEGVPAPGDPDIAALVAGLPSFPATARRECLMACGFR